MPATMLANRSNEAQTMKRLFAMCMGVREMRLTHTTHYEDYEEQMAYEYGRAIAHSITFHYFDPT